MQGALGRRVGCYRGRPEQERAGGGTEGGLLLSDTGGKPGEVTERGKNKGEMIQGNLEGKHRVNRKKRYRRRVRYVSHAERERAIRGK